MRDRGLVIDFSYTLVKPEDVTRLFRLPYKILGVINPSLREAIIRLAELRPVRYMEYITEEIFLHYNPLRYSPSPLVFQLVLARAHEHYAIIVSSREPRKRLEEGINGLRYSGRIDGYVCRDDVGIGVVRKEHVMRGIEKLHERFAIQPEHCTVISDSQSDLEEGRRQSTRTLWVKTGYHKKLRGFTPDGVFSSLETALLTLVDEAEQGNNQIPSPINGVS